MNDFLYILADSLILLLRLYSNLIVIAALCSWFLKPTNKFYRILRQVTAPVVYPFRGISLKLTQRMRIPMDFSTVMAYLALQILIAMLTRAFY